ncbi:MAG TPA: transcriptional repressor LexA [Ktedonobacterales bacterium]
MHDELSDRQLEIMLYIEDYIRDNRMPPTNREIGAHFEIKSTGHVDYHLRVLEERAYITREKKKSRSIKVLRPMRRQGLIIQGTIAAGQPLEIYAADQQEPLDLSDHMQAATAEDPHQREYVLLVRGQSMIEDHICDGDFVLIQRTPDAHDGDIIVAVKLTNGELGAATLKRFYRERSRIRLQPANATMAPIYVSAREWDEEWQIQGKVKAVYRRCDRR